jgi:hypothetical protein
MQARIAPSHQHRRMSVRRWDQWNEYETFIVGYFVAEGVLWLVLRY